MKHILFLAFILFFHQPETSVNPDLEIVRQRVINDLLYVNVNEVRVRSLVERVSLEGSLSDINYTDLSRTGFQNAEHLSNILEMSRAYKREGMILILYYGHIIV
ncbi:MAG TPA: hypothetical protein DDW27_09275 [Bacteroidales bacterium]|nr:hypothetical protein [Bacteroidales bacterium]